MSTPTNRSKDPLEKTILDFEAETELMIRKAEAYKPEAFKPGTKVLVVGIIDETREEFEGKIGEVAGEVSKALGSDDIAYRVIFLNGYSGLVFHSELELIPLEEIIGEMRKRAAEINSLCDEMLLRLD